jgi:hypothetical protein
MVQPTSRRRRNLPSAIAATGPIQVRNFPDVNGLDGASSSWQSRRLAGRASANCGAGLTSGSSGLPRRALHRTRGSIHDRRTPRLAGSARGRPSLLPDVQSLHMPAEMRQKARTIDFDSLTLDELPDLKPLGDC